MQLRDRCRGVDDGASTSQAQPVHSLSDDYVFPEHLVKAEDWRQKALSNKTNHDTSTALSLAQVFDFVTKFSIAFNLSPVSEQQLDDAIVASTDALWSQVVVGLAVELLRGFTSLDQHHHIRMYHRNRVYRETNEDNYNTSLWEFFEHDWKMFKHGNTDLSNCFANSKEEANLLKMEPRVRAAILNDLCQYRLTCFDAQDTIDSMIKEGDTLGDELRTVPIGRSSNEQYFYLGGSRVYRCTMLTSRTTKPHDGRTARRARANNKRTKYNSKRKEEPDDAMPNGQECNTHTTLVEQSQMEWWCEEDCTWEVLCRNEEDIHWLIEALRSSRHAWCVSLVSALITRVLPNLIKNKTAERNRQRSVPLPAPVVYADSTKVRHSSRLQTKKAHRMQQLEEARQQDLELEAELREEECRRAVACGTPIPVEMCKQMTRDERTRLREQRMEQFNRERLLSMERKHVLSAPDNAQPLNGAQGRELYQPNSAIDIGLPRNASILPVEEPKQRVSANGERASSVNEYYTRDGSASCSSPNNGTIPLFRNWQYRRWTSTPPTAQDNQYSAYMDGAARTRPIYLQSTPCKRTRRSLQEERMQPCLYGNPLLDRVHAHCNNHHSADASLSSAYDAYTSLEQDTYSDYLQDNAQYNATVTDGQAFLLPDSSSPASPHFYSSDQVLSEVDEHTTSAIRNDMATCQDETELGYVDYPTFKEGVLQWFRLVEPIGTRVLLHRDGPLQDHDYYLPSVEEMVANKWRFSVDPIDRSSSDRNNDFCLFFGDADGHVNASFGHALKQDSTNTCTSLEYANTYC